MLGDFDQMFTVCACVYEWGIVSTTLQIGMYVAIHRKLGNMSSTIVVRLWTFVKMEYMNLGKACETEQRFDGSMCTCDFMMKCVWFVKCEHNKVEISMWFYFKYGWCVWVIMDQNFDLQKLELSQWWASMHRWCAIFISLLFIQDNGVMWSIVWCTWHGRTPLRQFWCVRDHNTTYTYFRTWW